MLIDSAEFIDFERLKGAGIIGLTAGASAPEDLVEGVIDALSRHFDLTVEEDGAMRESVSFKLPRILTEDA